MGQAVNHLKAWFVLYCFLLLILILQMSNAEPKLPNVPLVNTKNQHIITISSALLLALVHIEPSPLLDHAIGIVFVHVFRLGLSFDIFHRKLKSI